MKFYEPGRHQAATQIGTYFALLETIKRYQNEEIEPLGGEQRSRWAAPQVLAMFPAWGAKCGPGGESGEGVLGNTGVLLLLFRPSDKGHCLYKKRSFLLLRNSGCQITDKYQTATPCRPHYLRRAVKNILRPALPP